MAVVSVRLPAGTTFGARNSTPKKARMQGNVCFAIFWEFRSGERPRLLQNMNMFQSRAEGPTVSRPGREAGIMIRKKVSAEGATHSMFAGDFALRCLFLHHIWLCAAPSVLILTPLYSPASRPGLLTAGPSDLVPEAGHAHEALQQPRPGATACSFL
jgi:hypothetical protein